MSTVVLCCNTLEDEMNLALAETGLEYPVHWLEAGLHDQPGRLRAHLAEVLSGLGGEVDLALVAMGHCGGASTELGPFPFRLVLPRVDDCLSFIMGSQAGRLRASRQAATYFLTAGWLRHTENLVASFDRDQSRFGLERAERIYKLLLNHYRRFGFIDTGAYDLSVQEDKIRPLSERLGLGLARLPGNLGWLRRLLTGPWDEADFISLVPGRTLTAEGWRWPADPAGSRDPVERSEAGDD